MIQVTNPFLPPIDEYLEHIKGIWDRNSLTNAGPLSKQLEAELANYLGVKNFVLVSNGTISLQMAFTDLGLKGEVITTPFSYIATINSLIWQHLKPVFADIDAHTFNIDPKTIRPLINKETSAILATHVFGCPCDNDAISAIAEERGIKIIYDAAHCFGVKKDNKSILNWGDVSSLSMHATKLYHTIEGGGLITNSDEQAYRFSKMRNFGHEGYDKYLMPGINAKCSEFHAAMGLVNLKYIDRIIEKRKSVYEKYLSLLSSLKNIYFQKIDLSGLTYNYSYFPIVFDSENTLLEIVDALNAMEIYPRRYFYPSLNTIWNKEMNHKCEISEDISTRILCLPLSTYIEEQDVEKICHLITERLSR